MIGQEIARSCVHGPHMVWGVAPPTTPQKHTVYTCTYTYYIRTHTCIYIYLHLFKYNIYIFKLLTYTYRDHHHLGGEGGTTKCWVIYTFVYIYIYICTWYKHINLYTYVFAYVFVYAHHTTSSADERRFTNVAGAKVDGFTQNRCRVLERSGSKNGKLMRKTHSIT